MYSNASALKTQTQTWRKPIGIETKATERTPEWGGELQTKPNQSPPSLYSRLSGYLYNETPPVDSGGYSLFFLWTRIYTNLMWMNGLKDYTTNTQICHLKHFVEFLTELLLGSVLNKKTEYKGAYQVINYFSNSQTHK